MGIRHSKAHYLESFQLGHLVKRTLIRGWGGEGHHIKDLEWQSCKPMIMVLQGLLCKMVHRIALSERKKRTQKEERGGLYPTT